VIRLVTAVFVALLPAATVGAATTSSGLHGRVMRGPITPVCVAEHPCSAPAKNLTLFFSRDGHIDARATTNAQGWYRVTLHRGLYSVSTTMIQAPGRRLTPTRATVLANQYRRLDFSIDTGIR
jgi:hypothetical protein